MSTQEDSKTMDVWKSYCKYTCNEASNVTDTGRQ